MQRTSIKHYTKLCISQTLISYSPGATHAYLSSPGWPCQDLLSSSRTFLFDKEKVNGPCLLIDESALTKGKPSAIRAIQLHLAGTPQNASQWIKEPRKQSITVPLRFHSYQLPCLSGTRLSTICVSFLQRHQDHQIHLVFRLSCYQHCFSAHLSLHRDQQLCPSLSLSPCQRQDYLFR